MATISNKKGSKAVFHVTSNTTLVIAGNNTVSNVTSASDEVVESATILKVWYGATSNSTVTGAVTVKRGANTVGVYTGTGHALYDYFGTSLNLDPTANLVIEIAGPAGYAMVEIHKKSTFNDEYRVN